MREHVVVVWSPGVGRPLAERLISEVGLPALGWQGSDGPHVAHHCRGCGSSDHGRPHLVGASDVRLPHLSISYADDLTVVALSTGGPVGVDVERQRAAQFAGFAAVAGDEVGVADAAFNSVTWTRKESLLKAVGRGLAIDPRRVRLSSAQQPAKLIAWEADEPPEGPVWMDDLELSAGYVAAVTVLAQERPRLTVRRAGPEGSAGRAKP